MIDVDSSTFLACAIIRCDTARKRLILNGEMSEWLKEHAWKACVGETLPWVRIPLSPPSASTCAESHASYIGMASGKGAEASAQAAHSLRQPLTRSVQSLARFR